MSEQSKADSRAYSADEGGRTDHPMAQLSQETVSTTDHREAHLLSDADRQLGIHETGESEADVEARETPPRRGGPLSTEANDAF